MDFKPYDFDKVYPVEMSYSKLLKEFNIKNIFGNYVSDVIAMYKVSIDRKENNKMKDFIVVHDEGQIAIILKNAITGICKRTDSTVIYFDGNAFYCDDKYEDIVKQYLA